MNNSGVNFGETKNFKNTTVKKEAKVIDTVAIIVSVCRKCNDYLFDKILNKYLLQ
jgi:hypothetical protein